MPVHYVCHRMDSCGGKCWYDNRIAEGYGGIVGNTNDATVEQFLNTSAQQHAISLPHTEHIGAISGHSLGGTLRNNLYQRRGL